MSVHLKIQVHSLPLSVLMSVYLKMCTCIFALERVDYNAEIGEICKYVMFG